MLRSILHGSVEVTANASLCRNRSPFFFEDLVYSHSEQSHMISSSESSLQYSITAIFLFDKTFTPLSYLPTLFSPIPALLSILIYDQQ